MGKKTWAVIFIILALVISGGAMIIKVKYFEAGSFLDVNTTRLRVDQAARYDAAGGDIRYYVITPPRPNNSHMSCGIAAGENNSSQFCWVKQGWYLDPELGWREVRP